ncbi:MAG: hybrid sensor histidine kinase/response regulator [Desulfuromonas sp.]|nr:MAG: hybrid sensor histidine kinase/response regulator [Desulfuromonas sp.]
MCARALDCFDVTQATDGRDALSLISQHPFDIILSDIMMPNLSGLELLRTIKETNPEQMVILMTGYSEKEVILQALKAGADDFISKPVNLLQLRTAIEKAVEKQALRREISSLKHLDQLKSEFLGLVSHKLKTPATAISLFIQNIAADNSDLNDPAFRQMLKMVQAETHHLEHLIQDLLYFSNVILHQDELRLESVDLGKTARQIVQHLAPVAEKKKLQLAVDITSPFPPQPLQLDRTRISFVLRALLDNAIKFTPAEGVIQLKGVLEKGTAKLSVRDNGPGIPSEELTKVFAKFYQVDPSSSGQIRGFGLGLFYARQFIQSMNGELSLESQPDFGTVASIELPLTT